MAIISDRLLAVDVLKNVISDNGSLTTLLSRQALEQPGANHPLVREMSFGVCRWYHRLSFLASRLMDKPLRRKDQDIHCLVLLGLYQLFHMRIPDHAVINETVAVTGQLNKVWARGLVNAVLRNAVRRRDMLTAELEADEGALYSHPAWLLERLQADWPEHFAGILQGNNTQAPMALRVNTRRGSRHGYLGMLAEAGIGAVAGANVETAIILAQAMDVARLPGFADGLVSVQDEASQLAAALLDPPSGARVLDACAAPGGKTCALLERQPEIRAMLALDNNSERLDKIRENITRLGLAADIACADAAAPDTWWDGRPFDAILLDAPCSGTGVIRRHPDIKLLRGAGDPTRLAATQGLLLAALWPCLKPGGRLLYSTCTVLREENEKTIARFLETGVHAQPVPLSHPAALPCPVGMQFLPGREGMDGFYYALLEKY